MGREALGCEIASVPVSKTVVPLQPFRLIVTGGVTGSHTHPALTAVRAMRGRFALEDRPLDVLWVGAHDSLEAVASASVAARRPLSRATKLQRTVRLDAKRDP